MVDEYDFCITSFLKERGFSKEHLTYIHLYIRFHCMRRTQIYLEEKQYTHLVRESEKKGISIAEYIRELINKALPKEEEWENHSFWNIGEDEFSTGEKRGSLEHDRIIYKSKKSVR